MKQSGGVNQIVSDATTACFFSARVLEVEQRQAGEQQSFLQTLRP
jgi:hypothetical protein